MGRARYGTGFAGSETYSSNSASPAVGESKLSLSPVLTYKEVARIAQFEREGQPLGHESRRRQVLVPVSNAVTGATSAFGALSFRYWSRNGRRICVRKYRPVSLLNLIAPSELPSSISCP